MKIQIKGDIVDDESAEILEIFGFSNFTSPKSVIKALEDAGNQPVTVEINSPGGYLTAASEIYTALLNHKAGVTGEIVGVAASAASIIACATSPLKITPTGQIMIHNASLDGVKGNKFDMEEFAGALDTFDRSQLNAYEHKTGMTREELEPMLNATTYLDAKKAVELGFADEIMFQEDTVAVASSGTTVTPEVLARMKSVLATSKIKPQTELDIDVLASKVAEKIQGIVVETPQEEPKKKENLLARLAKNI